MGQCSTKPLADGEQAPAAPLTRSEKKRAAKELARRAKKASSHASQLARRADARGPARTLAVAAHRRIADAACCSSHALSQRVSGLRTLDQLLPRRGSDGFIADQLARRESMPTAPAVLYTAMHEAIQAGNLQWATSNAEVAALLAEDVTYVDLRGEEAVGKEATLKSMDEAVERLLRRISRSTRSGKTEVKNDHIKLKATPAERMSKGVWVVVFSFKLYLMTVRVQEEYTMDETGLLIKRLKRTMANAAQLKAVTA